MSSLAGFFLARVVAEYHVRLLGHRALYGAASIGRGQIAAAREVRIARAALKRALRTGAFRPEAVLLDPPSFTRGARLREILEAVPGIGPAKSARLARAAGVAPDSRVGDLPESARRVIAESLRASEERNQT